MAGVVLRRARVTGYKCSSTGAKNSYHTSETIMLFGCVGIYRGYVVGTASPLILSSVAVGSSFQGSTVH